MGYHQKDQILVCKSNFALGGVHVDIKFHVGHVQEQYRNGFTLCSIGLVGLLHRLANHLAFDGAITDEQKLVVALAVCFGGRGDIPPNVDTCFGIVYRQKDFGDFRANGFGDPVSQFPGNSCKYRFIANFVVKTDFGVGYGRL